MVEKLKRVFSNSPKAKRILSVSAGIIVCGVIFTMTVITMRKTVTISIDGNEEVFVTYKGTVNEVLQDKGVEIDSKDKVQPSLDSKILNNEEIVVKKAVDVNLVASGQELQIKTAEDTVGDMLIAEEANLSEKGITYAEGLDEVTPSVDTPITSDLQVQLVKVEVYQEVAVESIPYSVEWETDYTKTKNYSAIKQAGENGEKEVTYEYVKKDGEVISKDVVSVKNTKAAVTQIGVVGGLVSITRGGSEITGKKELTCEATAYTGHGTTATGRKTSYDPQGLSTIAVDPRVIPLGSKVYVDGYGYAIAADTGSAIKGNIIDVYFNSSSQVSNWGRRKGVKVIIVAYPGEW